MHRDADGDNLCDNCGETVKEAFRCGFCDKYEAWKDIEYFGLIVSIPCLVFHAMMRRRAARRISGLETLGVALEKAFA